jgi:hypothetical protein
MRRISIVFLSLWIPLISFAQLRGIKPGDILQVNGVKGIVFKVDEEGAHGQMMSVKAFRGKENLYCNKSSRLKGLKMADENNGQVNTEELLSFTQAKGISLSDYPVFNWCKSLGEGWYIPSVNQLKAFVNYWVGNTDVVVDWEEDGDEPSKASDDTTPHTKLVNDKLLNAGGIPFLNGVFTSTLDDGKKVEVFYFNKEDGKWTFEKINPMKIDAFCVGRAFFDF